MNLTYKRLGQAKATASAATIYTCPAATKAVIKCISFTNSDTSTRTVSVYIVPDGDSAGVANILVANQKVIVGNSFSVLMWQAMEAAEVIQIVADVTDKVTITASGAEIT